MDNFFESGINSVRAAEEEVRIIIHKVAINYLAGRADKAMNLDDVRDKLIAEIRFLFDSLEIEEEPDSILSEEYFDTLGKYRGIFTDITNELLAEFIQYVIDDFDSDPLEKLELAQKNDF